MNRFFDVLKIRPFLFLWLSELFSQIAMNMMNFILILVVYSITNSNTAVSGAVLSFTVPAIIFGILAGVYVDRWNKKSVLISTNAIRFLILIILAFFHTNLVIIYGLSLFSAVITQFFIPAETPMIPILVPKDKLLTANALFSMAWFGSVLIAYGLSGPFLIFFGQETALFVLAVIFLLACFFASVIKLPKNKNILQKSSSHVGLFQEIKKAFVVIFQITDVKHAFSLLIFSQILILIIAVLGPGYAKNILQIDINQFPLLFVFPSIIGMMVGSVIITNFFHNRSRHKIATLGLFVGAFATGAMPFVSKVNGPGFIAKINILLPGIVEITMMHAMVALAFILGVANALIFVPSNTLVQENTKDEIRGKIYGTLNTFAALASLIPVIAVGGLADIFGVGNVLLFLGISIGIIGFFRLTL